MEEVIPVTCDEFKGLWFTMTDESDVDQDEWIHYDAFAYERNEDRSTMLEYLEIGGPGPPFEFPEPPDFFFPPPPIPGNVEECVSFSSHFDSCGISKVNIIKFHDLSLIQG